MALLWLTGPTGAGKSTTGAFLRDEHQVSQRRSSMSFYFFCFYPVVFLWRRLFPLSCSKSLRIWSSGCVSKHLERSWSCYSFNRLPTGKKKYELEQAVDEERRRICRRRLENDSSQLLWRETQAEDHHFPSRIVRFRSGSSTLVNGRPLSHKPEV